MPNILPFVPNPAGKKGSGGLSKVMTPELICGFTHYGVDLPGENEKAIILPRVKGLGLAPLPKSLGNDALRECLALVIRYFAVFDALETKGSKVEWDGYIFIIRGNLNVKKSIPECGGTLAGMVGELEDIVKEQFMN